jgi:N-acyl-D-amino-acid deacylase
MLVTTADGRSKVQSKQQHEDANEPRTARLIRGGTVVDGTGAAGRAADVRIRAGQIVEVGRDLSVGADEAVIDARGAIVAPGFIESHTHLDGSMWWDTSADPLPSYGSTTAIMGNCGLTVAPLSAATRNSIVELFCFIEDLPLDVFRSRIPFSWENWADYRKAAMAQPSAVNLGAYVGHQSLRTFVMGDEAWDRPATADERAQLASVLDDALRAGALGFSTTFMDTDRDNREVPSRVADDAEFGALLDVVARHPGATFQFVPRFMQAQHFAPDVERMAALAGPRGVRTLWAGLRCESALRDERIERLEMNQRINDLGGDFSPNYSHAPTYVFLHFDRSIMWHGVMSWHEMVNSSSAEEKLRLLADESWRARARADWDACTYTLVPISRPQQLMLEHSGRELDGETGMSLHDYAAQRNLHLSDALAAWLLCNGIDSSMKTAIRPLDEAGVCELVRAPGTVTGASDTGAHIQMFSGAGNATYLLTHYVRDTGLLTIEEAVHAVTGKHADFFGLRDRGIVAPGKAADLVVFDLDEIDLHDEVRVDDIPGGSWRYSRPPGGYRATLVNGEPTWLDGAATGATPGRFVAAT